MTDSSGQRVEWWDQSVFKEWIIIERLAGVILHYVKGCIVEIGLGHSTPVLAKYAKKFNIRHYAVDIDAGRCRKAEKNPVVKHDGFIVYNGRSLDFIETFDDTPALVFIDGCHDAEIVIQEAMFFIDKIPPGGVIFLHDTFLAEEWEQRIAGLDWFSDTYRARWELENLKDIWCFTFPYTARALGLTMIMKRPEYEYDSGHIGESYRGRPFVA